MPLALPRFAREPGFCTWRDVERIAWRHGLPLRGHTGQLTAVAVTVVPESGDTLANGRDYREVYPVTAPDYAAATEWFQTKVPITIVDGRHFTVQGLPFRGGRWELIRAGDYQGAPFFVPSTDPSNPDIIRTPHGCLRVSYAVRHLSAAGFRVA